MQLDKVETFTDAEHDTITASLSRMPVLAELLSRGICIMFAAPVAGIYLLLAFKPLSSVRSLPATANR